MRASPPQAVRAYDRRPGRTRGDGHGGAVGAQRARRGRGDRDGRARPGRAFAGTPGVVACSGGSRCRVARVRPVAPALALPVAGRRVAVCRPPTFPRARPPRLDRAGRRGPARRGDRGRVRPHRRDRDRRPREPAQRRPARAARAGRGTGPVAALRPGRAERVVPSLRAGRAAAVTVSLAVSRAGADLVVRVAAPDAARLIGVVQTVRRLLGAVRLVVRRLDGEHLEGLAATLALGLVPPPGNPRALAPHGTSLPPP